MSRKAAVVIVAAVVACSAGALLLSRVARAEEQASRTASEILQAKVSLSVQNARGGEFTRAVLEACGDAANRLGASGFRLDGGAGPGGSRVWDSKSRITLSVSNVRVGDLLRAFAALHQGDVYMKGPTHVVITYPNPETMQELGITDVRPLTADDY